MTLIEVVMVVAVLGFITWIILPMFAHSKHGPGHARIKCVSNLKQVGLAYKIFAGDNDDKYPMATRGTVAFTNESTAWLHYQAMSNELLTAHILVCPADQKRNALEVRNFQTGTNANSQSLEKLGNSCISYFVGLDAREDSPRSVLSGDRNLQTNQMHLVGNIVSLHKGRESGWTSEIHDSCGNALLADGSVYQWRNQDFAAYTQTNELARQRLLLPLAP